MTYTFDDFKNSSDITIKQYLEEFKLTKTGLEHQQRQKLLQTEICNYLNDFNFDTSQISNWDLQNAMPINIADHHTILNKQMLWLGHIMESQIFKQNSTKFPIVILSGSTVVAENAASTNNLSVDGNIVTHFYENFKTKISLNLFAKQDFDWSFPFKAINNLSSTDKNIWLDFWCQFWLENSKKLNEIDTHINQITYFNNKLWSKLNTLPVNSLTELFYVPLELVATNIILKNPDLIYFDLLFEEAILGDILKEFEGINTCWNLQKNTGTHFFWYKHGTTNKMIRMYLKDGYLIPQYRDLESVKIKWDKAAILNELEKGTIIPSVFLCETVCSLWTGISKFAGFASTIYLDQMLDIWLKILKKHNYQNEFDLLSKIPPNFLTTGFSLLAKDDNPELSIYDLVLNGGINQDLIDQLLNTKISNIYTKNKGFFDSYFKNKT